MARPAPGVTIEVQDNSAYDIIDNPSIIGGIVGFSPKGELNKILRITNTSVQDKTLGLGYQQAKYNMGLYATRAILNNGGYVHFVRPYGEQVVKTDKYQSDLKSDAFVVSFDRGASKSDYAEICDPDRQLGHTSMDIRHFAATRYVEDGFAGFGGKRKINTIQETIAENSNTDFYLTAGTEFNEEGKPNDVRSDTNIVLFSIVNTDPTSAQRASDRYNVTSIKAGGNDKYTLTCDSIPSFIVGDVIFIPSRYLDAAHKASGKGVYATVTKILDNDVTVVLSETVTNGIAVGTSGFAFYCNNDDTTTGVDYLTVKTAVASRAVKKYGKFVYNKTTKPIPGSLLSLYDTNHEEQVVRLIGAVIPTNNTLTISDDKATVSFTNTTSDSNILIGDTLTIYYTGDDTDKTSKSITAVVSNIEDTSTAGKSTVTCEVSVDPTIEDASTYTISKYTITPNEDSYNATADIATISIPTERQSILFNPIKTDATYAFKQNEDESYDKSTIVLTTARETEYKAKTAQNELIKELDALYQNEELIVSIDDTTSVSGIYASYSTKIVKNTAATSTINTEGDTATNTETNSNLTTEASGTTYTVVAEINLYKALDTTSTTLTGFKVRCKVDDDTSVSDDDIIADGTNKYYVESVGHAGELTLSQDGKTVTSGTLSGILVNMTVTTNNILAALGKLGYKINSYIGEDATLEATGTTSTQMAIQVPAGTSTQYTIGDLVSLVEQKRNGKQDSGIFTINDVFVIADINTYKDIIYVDYDETVENKTKQFGKNTTWKLIDLTASNANVWASGIDGLTFYMIGAYGLKVSSSSQLDGFVVSTGDYDSSDWFTFSYTSYEDGIIERTDKVLISDEVGATFASYGLATVKYEDDTFSGNSKQMYVLSSEGEAIARMYVYINYYFNGKSYEFEGTLAPYLHDGNQLYIKDVADNVLTNSGVKFMLNDSGILDNFLENNAYDLSQTVCDGHLDSVTTKLSFDEHDPAILNDAIWKYLPSNNNDSSTLSNAWNLFLDKDRTDVHMLVSAGTNINSLFVNKHETLNTTVMSAMLDVCELRKDCFAIMDGVGEANIETTLKKMNAVQGFGTKGRWGACYDGRGIFYDSYYTMLNVDVVKSVQLASLISANCKNGIWWFPPAGEDGQGTVPSEWGTDEKYPRTYNRAEDTTSDIARLIELHVNPTRCNDDGMFIWGDWTMQKATTAFDQIHVAMLIAGIHKRFYHYLDKKTFKINSTNLRADITSDLQAQLDMIKKSNPPGLYSGYVVCDDSNNTAEIIDQNQLIVELKLKTTKTARYITLRTTVESNGSSNTQTSTLSV